MENASNWISKKEERFKRELLVLNGFMSEYLARAYDCFYDYEKNKIYPNLLE